MRAAKIMRSSVITASVLGLSVGSVATAAPTGEADVIPLHYEVELLQPPPAEGGDTYSMRTYGGWWHAVAVQSKSANDTLSVYSSEDRATLLARSSLGGSEIDFVAAWNAEVPTLYPVVSRRSGTGNYTIESSVYDELTTGQSLPFRIRKSDLVRTFTAPFVSAGETLIIAVDPLNEKLDVSVFLMSTSGPAAYKPRVSAVASSSDGGRGETETLVYEVTVSSTYGIVVLYEKGGGAYNISRVDS